MHPPSMHPPSHPPSTSITSIHLHHHQPPTTSASCACSRRARQQSALGFGSSAIRDVSLPPSDYIPEAVAGAMTEFYESNISPPRSRGRSVERGRPFERGRARSGGRSRSPSGIIGNLLKGELAERLENSRSAEQLERSQSPPAYRDSGPFRSYLGGVAGAMTEQLRLARSGSPPAHRESGPITSYLRAERLERSESPPAGRSSGPLTSYTRTERSRSPPAQRYRDPSPLRPAEPGPHREQEWPSDETDGVYVYMWWGIYVVGVCIRCR